MVAQTYALHASLWKSVSRPDVDPSFILGVTRPTSANTGLNVLKLTTSDLTVIDGDLLIDNAWVTANGNTLDRKWVKGFVTVTASTVAGLVTISNCKISGRTITPGSPPKPALVNADGTGRLNVINCEISPIQPDVNISNVAGVYLNYIYRCDMSLGSDIIDWWSTTSGPNIKGCWLHDYTFWANDSKHTNDSVHPGWSHNDAIQHPGSVWPSTGGIIGNAIAMYAHPSYGDFSTLAAFSTFGAYGANIILTTTNAPHVNAKIQSNWMRGGEQGVFLVKKNLGFDTGNSWDVSGNRFVPDARGYNWGTSQYTHHMVAFDKTLGPDTTSVHNNFYDTVTGVPEILKGTSTPALVSVGTDYLMHYISNNQMAA